MISSPFRPEKGAYNWHHVPSGRVRKTPSDHLGRVRTTGECLIPTFNVLPLVT